MKKLFPFLAFLMLISFLSVLVQAEDSSYSYTGVSSGYTADGIYFEIHSEASVLIQDKGEKVIVSQTLVYDGKIAPKSKIFWQESRNRIQYAGVLYLVRKEFDSVENITTAVYMGTLTFAY